MQRLRMKKIHLYVTRQFIPLLVLTVSICWFVVVMQFVWQHTDDFIGKGLDVVTLAKVFYNASLMALPTALPLGILLASLMTFGGLGERLELLAVKSAGLPLQKVMLSPALVSLLLGAGLFVYLNTVMMESQVRFYQIAFSARQKQPDLEIPEGSFYNGIDNYSIFVGKKNPRDKTLLGVLIYDLSQGFRETRIIRADSGKLTMDVSKTFLTLDLYNGESFQQLKEPISPAAEKKVYDPGVPASYYKENFNYKKILIPFDANFTLQSDEGLRNQYVGKNLWQLTRYIQDTAKYAMDSVGMRNVDLILDQLHNTLDNTSISPRRDSTKRVLEQYAAIEEAASQRPVTLDSLLQKASPEKVSNALESASEKLRNLSSEAEMRYNDYNWQAYFYRTHDQERHRKFTFPVACIAFFFIGAPLGAIIRKGGIGTPMVTSVLLYILYYMVDTYGYKMGYNGEWPVWLGMWLSTFFLIPLGVWLTYEVSRDSSSLNLEKITAQIKLFFKPEQKRELRLREIFMHPLSDVEALKVVDQTLEKLNSLQNAAFMQGGLPSYHNLSALNLLYYNGYLAVERMIDKLLDRPGYLLPVKLAEIPVCRRYFVSILPRHRWIYWLLLGVVPLSLPFICYLYVTKQKQRKKIIRLKSKIADLKRVILNPEEALQGALEDDIEPV